ncbi:MAG: hypothetical protein C9356_11885 [Oleiphilus sp.]|nr:MAG: hypothetical protein C9356_11885 [Oleiphilus sp.]
MDTTAGFLPRNFGHKWSRIELGIYEFANQFGVEPAATWHYAYSQSGSAFMYPGFQTESITRFLGNETICVPGVIVGMAATILSLKKELIVSKVASERTRVSHMIAALLKDAQTLAESIGLSDLGGVLGITDRDLWRYFAVKQFARDIPHWREEVSDRLYHYLVPCVESAMVRSPFGQTAVLPAELIGYYVTIAALDMEIAHRSTPMLRAQREALHYDAIDWGKRNNLSDVVYWMFD